MYSDLEPDKVLDLLHLPNRDMYAEYDIGKRPSGAELETEIFISKEKVADEQSLDLNVVYTPYKGALTSLTSKR